MIDTVGSEEHSAKSLAFDMEADLATIRNLANSILFAVAELDLEDEVRSAIECLTYSSWIKRRPSKACVGAPPDKIEPSLRPLCRRSKATGAAARIRHCSHSARSSINYLRIGKRRRSLTIK